MHGSSAQIFKRYLQRFSVRLHHLNQLSSEIDSPLSWWFKHYKMFTTVTWSAQKAPPRPTDLKLCFLFETHPPVRKLIFVTYWKNNLIRFPFQKDVSMLSIFDPHIQCEFETLQICMQT